MYNQVLKEAAKGNFKPLARYLLVGLPLGYGAGQARGLLRGQPMTGIKGNQDKPGTGLGSTALESSKNVGALGMGSDALFVAQNRASGRLDQYLAGAVGGPTAGQAVETTKNVASAFSGKRQDIERQGVGLAPVAGPYLKNKLMPYALSGQPLVDTNLKKDKGVTRTLKDVNLSVGAPRKQQRNKNLTDPQYKEFVNKSTQEFINKVNRAKADSNFQNLPPDMKKKTLSKALSDARSKTLNSMIGKAPKHKSTKLRSY